MAIRRLCIVAAVFALLVTSGCCHRHGCCRKRWHDCSPACCSPCGDCCGVCCP